MRRHGRRRRASLRGSWRVLPFVAMVGGTLFSFTWLESARLKNEYRAIELSREIQEVKDEVARLCKERHDLGRLERMNEAAPVLELHEPAPGQVLIVKVSEETERRFVENTADTLGPPPTRSVRIALDSRTPSAPTARIARHHQAAGKSEATR